jgi:protein-tyrosine phosphatase
MAGIVLRDKARELGLDDALDIATAGVSSEEQGNPMDRRAVQVLRERGYDTSDPLVRNHRARKTTPEEVAEVNLLLPMTHSHADALVSRFGADPAKIYMWRWFEGRVLGAQAAENYASGHLAEDLADPWYGGHDDFAQALDELEASAEAIVRFAVAMLTS